MKGVIIAGGKATRLYPVTCGINKHALPVGKKPMIGRAYDTLSQLGCTDIVIVTNMMGVVQFHPYFTHMNIPVTYALQEEAKGITDALLKAEPFVGIEPCYVILGDGLYVSQQTPITKRNCAATYLTSVADPRSFGVYEGKYIREKPQDPQSNLVSTGLYYFPSGVFTLAQEIEPSERGEYEITSLLNKYADLDRLETIFVNGVWLDTGTFESLEKANREWKE